MFSMILDASLIVLDRDLLLIDTASSSSDLISYWVVDFFTLHLSQISSRPVANRATVGNMKGYTANSSSLRDLSSVMLLS